MTTDLTTLAAQIEERLTEDETTAAAAGDSSGGDWFTAQGGLDMDPDEQNVMYAGPSTLGYPGLWEYPVAEKLTTGTAEHIARNDPARVLRRVAVTRELVAAILAEPHDSARNPAGHQRVARLLGIIASEWEDK